MKRLLILLCLLPGLALAEIHPGSLVGASCSRFADSNGTGSHSIVVTFVEYKQGFYIVQRLAADGGRELYLPINDCLIEEVK